MPVSSMPLLFKDRQTDRYSESKRPVEGERCFFSHALCLIQGEFVERKKEFVFEWIKQNAVVRVIGNTMHLVEVMFDGASESDLVSPEFLKRVELTEFGQVFFDQTRMSPETRKYFVGESVA